jgi:hypothetical protein
MRILSFADDGTALEPADLPWLGEHLLILKPRAVDALWDLYLSVGELLPLACRDADLVVWNVT